MAILHPELISPPELPAPVYKAIGAAALLANWIRKNWLGYRRARGFSPSEIDRALAHVRRGVTEWLGYLDDYSNGQFVLDRRRILELGPGPDLGVGALLLSKGAAQYTALDVNRLLDDTPAGFYERLFADQSIAPVRGDVEAALRGQPSRLRYVCDRDFDPRVAVPDGVDLVLSQAAFEHFDNVPTLFAQLNEVLAPGAWLCAQIDLETHVEWLRRRDPLNIYRFSKTTYRSFHYPGAPNRLRPRDYVNMLERAGWRDVRIYSMKQLAPAYLALISRSLAQEFRGGDMDLLGVMILARRP